MLIGAAMVLVFYMFASLYAYQKAQVEFYRPIQVGVENE